MALKGKCVFEAGFTPIFAHFGDGVVFVLGAGLEFPFIHKF
jgi:hypothetical protein